jgi:hypothetical protein
LSKKEVVLLKEYGPDNNNCCWAMLAFIEYIGGYYESNRVSQNDKGTILSSSATKWTPNLESLSCSSSL